MAWPKHQNTQPGAMPPTAKSDFTNEAAKGLHKPAGKKTGMKAQLPLSLKGLQLAAGLKGV